MSRCKALRTIRDIDHPLQVPRNPNHNENDRYMFLNIWLHEIHAAWLMIAVMMMMMMIHRLEGSPQYLICDSNPLLLSITENIFSI